MNANRTESEKMLPKCYVSRHYLITTVKINEDFYVLECTIDYSRQLVTFLWLKIRGEKHITDLNTNTETTLGWSTEIVCV